jgi:probable DNA repair protein
MYGWLSDACDDTSHVVTANRRLARKLSAAHNEQQLAAGCGAWRTATIHSYGDWLARVLATASPGDVPARINSQQSRVLWERVIRELVSDPLVNIASLASQAREAWKRLHDWRVPLEEAGALASGRDQRLFAKAATAYRSILESNNWADEALLGSRFLEASAAGQLQLPSRVTLAGFDRTTPLVDATLDVLRNQGTNVETAPPGESGDVRMFACDDPDTELRSAGAWARRELEDRPDEQIAIVVSDLEQNAGRAGRLIREGFVPGWQCGSAKHPAAIDVSYGRRLSDYPAIQIALLLLRWVHRELSGRDVSLLLRSPFAGGPVIGGRARLELELRKSADRKWSPERLLRALAGRDDAADAEGWLGRLSELSHVRKTVPRQAAPAYWAQCFDSILADYLWPGEETLDSRDFQLVNRWRELLNDLARLELVAPTMTIAAASAELVSMANETIFQPEIDAAVVQVLRPLEAAGLVFDRLWVTGMTADQWPPPRHPMPLLSRQLQRHYGMPDADPLDTAEYAARVLGRLAASAPDCRFSYPVTDADAEQTPATLLGPVNIAATPDDPGWHAAALCGRAGIRLLNDDPVPAIRPREKVGGGAGTIQKQCSEPFAAFVSGRLGVSRLQAITPGLSPLLRGNLVHSALFHLYEQMPSQRDIRSWDAGELEQRVDDAVNRAFLRYERHSDRLLNALLALERRRTAALLVAVVRVDEEREAFAVDAVEASVDHVLGGTPLKLRIDRVDRLADGSIAIFDYKTGTPKRLLDAAGDPVDVQLVVYACALGDPVATLGLFNIDSRKVAIDDVGLRATDAEKWAELLARWSRHVELAGTELAAGDVRLCSWQSARDARELNLLSRYAELASDA